MVQNIKMDSHKLIYHPQTVADWLKGKNIYPIEIEISPSGACNHRCVFCALDYVGYKPTILDKNIIIRDIRHMSPHGLKSVICSGEGEPLLNKDMPDIANEIKACGVDVAMSSNGVLLTREKAKECLAAFTWIRFSVASMEESSYDTIQRGNKGDLDRVKTNLSDAVQLKKTRKLKTTLGVQCLLMPENAEQLPSMARQLREIGVDYLTVKPYSQHKHSENHQFIDYDSLVSLEQELQQYVTEDFAVYFRANAMRKMHHEKNYKVCHGLPFMTYIDSRGNVWPCCAHIGVPGFSYGNIYDQAFEEIWNGEKRQNVVEKMSTMDINVLCREACRLDEINRYLDELKHPGEHVNFI